MAIWTIVPEQVVAVLGASGWLGRAILRVAAADAAFGDWRVIGLEGESPIQGLYALQGDLIEAGGPCTVVNAVGRRQGSEGALMESNVRFVKDLAVWAQFSGWRVLQVGSAAEYGPGRSEPFSEADEPHPNSVYGRSKLEATEALSGLLGASKSCVGRLFNVLGPNPPRGSVAEDIRAKMQGARESGKAPELTYPDTVRDFLLLDDAARLLLDLIPHIGGHQVVNVCSGQGLSWRQIANTVCTPLAPAPQSGVNRAPDVVVGNPGLLHSLVHAPAPPSPKSLALALLG